MPNRQIPYLLFNPKEFDFIDTVRFTRMHITLNRYILDIQGDQEEISPCGRVIRKSDIIQTSIISKIKVYARCDTDPTPIKAIYSSISSIVKYHIRFWLGPIYCPF